MPANLTPEYLKAEKWFRQAGTNEEKILALEEMLRVLPKHKGTDHMRADLRRKLSKFKEAATQRKSSGKHIDIFHIPKNGAGQITLLGTPNSGKSAIVAAVTNARVNVAEFLFATSAPVPGMMPYEDIQIQIVDMPPITADFVTPGQVNAYRNCDLIGIVVDLSNDAVEQLGVCVDFLDTRRLLMDEQIQAKDGQGNFLGRRAFVICTKADLAEADAVKALKKGCSRSFEFVEISTERSDSLDEFRRVCFRLLGVIRIYAKPPGRAADMSEPFTLPKGATVMDLAVDIHRQLAQKLRYARIWGTGVHDGQNVQRTHVLYDKDIIELHFS